MHDERAVAAARGAERKMDVEVADAAHLPLRPSAPSWSTARKASCGISTLPTRFMRVFALLLLLQQLALAGDVAAVALGEHVLAHRPHRLAGDDPAADRRLDRHLEQLARDQRAQLLHQGPAPGTAPCRGGDAGERASTGWSFTSTSSLTRSPRGSRRARSRARRSPGCGTSAGRRSRRGSPQRGMVVLRAARALVEVLHLLVLAAPVLASSMIGADVARGRR